LEHIILVSNRLTDVQFSHNLIYLVPDPDKDKEVPQAELQNQGKECLKHLKLEFFFVIRLRCLKLILLEKLANIHVEHSLFVLVKLSVADIQSSQARQNHKKQKHL
jgi:hypothetical protein